MNWYSTENPIPQLEALIDTNPSFQQITQNENFIRILLAQSSTKLNQYIAKSNQFLRQIVSLFSQNPTQNSSNDRKYKLPLLAKQLICHEQIDFPKLLLRKDPETNQPFILAGWKNILTNTDQSLPLLCGYFQQIDKACRRLYYKQMVSCIYEQKTLIFLFIEHLSNSAIINVAKSYLKLSTLTNPQSNIEHTNIRRQFLNKLIQRLQLIYRSYINQNNKEIIEIKMQNIFNILSYFLDQYYLMVDQRVIIDIITSKNNIDLCFTISLNQNYIGQTSLQFLYKIAQYYTKSSFNQQNTLDKQIAKNNSIRLQSQPFVQNIKQKIKYYVQILSKTKTFTIYHFKILQLLSIVIHLCSKDIFNLIKQTNFFKIILGYIFIFPNHSILHKKIQKIIRSLFESQKKNSQDYVKYLLCQGSLIQLTAGQCLNRIKQYQYSSRYGWLSILLKIIVTYSKIVTFDQDINIAIKQRQSLWRQFLTKFLQPDAKLFNMQLGSLTSTQQPKIIQFTVKYSSFSSSTSNRPNQKIIAQINQQQNLKINYQQNKQQKIQQLDPMFLVQKIIQIPNNNQQVLTSNQNIQNKKIQPVITKQETTTSNRFKQFMNNKKQQVQKDIHQLRKTSSQKRLSANKSRVTSPSPKKNNKWSDKPQQQNTSNKQISLKTVQQLNISKTNQQEIKKQKISITQLNSKNINTHNPPKYVPPSPKYIIQSKNQQKTQLSNSRTLNQLSSSRVSVQSMLNQSVDDNSFDQTKKNSSTLSQGNLNSSFDSQSSFRMTQSNIDFSKLKTIGFKKNRVVKPQKPAFRRIMDQDKVLLDFLGVKI